MSANDNYFANQTVFDELKNHIDAMSIDCVCDTLSFMNRDIDKEDLHLMKSSKARYIRDLPKYDGIGQKNDDIHAKFQIEFTNTGFRYIFTFTIMYCGGTPYCCATYELSYTKDKFNSDDGESA